MKEQRRETEKKDLIKYENKNIILINLNVYET